MKLFDDQFTNEQVLLIYLRSKIYNEDPAPWKDVIRDSLISLKKEGAANYDDKDLGELVEQCFKELNGRS